ncbi:MAG: GNAT family N-acetyltransferase [Blastocatellia bacterium]
MKRSAANTLFTATGLAAEGITGMEIVTKRLLLREFTEGDLPALIAYQADPRYAEFWPDATPTDHARELFHMFRRWVDECPRHNYQLAVARIRTPHELIGCCGLRGQGMDAGMAEFGIELAPRWWGHGFATEAARAILGFGFRELGLRDVRGVSVTENAGVTNVVSRLGFTLLGRRPGPAWMSDRGWSQTEWRLTREQWEATEAA